MSDEAPVSRTVSERLGCVVDHYADGSHHCVTCNGVWMDDDDEGEDDET